MQGVAHPLLEHRFAPHLVELSAQVEHGSRAGRRRAALGPCGRVGQQPDIVTVEPVTMSAGDA